MDLNEKNKLFNTIFAPKQDEKILFLIDVPHDDIKDNVKWNERREMAKEWYEIFNENSTKKGYTVDMLEYPATGLHNTPIPTEIIKKLERSNLVIALTEYSASSSLLKSCNKKQTITRAASMPLVEKRMEETAFKADYNIVKEYAESLEKILNNAHGAQVIFSTGDNLYIDLRNRKAMSEAGDCTKTGQCINFPSGEAWKSPYEASEKEIKQYGKSKTNGTWPVYYGKDIIKYIVKENKIIDVIGDSEKAIEMKKFFEENNSRRNIAELGLGCNPNAVVTGNPLEDEKVGLHIAYGLSTHLGGKIESDTHFDIIHAKNCPVVGVKLTLYNYDGTETDIIKNSKIRFELL